MNKVVIEETDREKYKRIADATFRAEKNMEEIEGYCGTEAAVLTIRYALIDSGDLVEELDMIRNIFWLEGCTEMSKHEVVYYIKEVRKHALREWYKWT